MLNDIKPPPREPPADPPPGGRGPPGPVVRTEPAAGTEARPHNPDVKPHEHIRPHTDPTEPGVHHARVMGEKATTDAIYAMPMEDRGSTFSVTLSIVVIVVFVVLLLTVWLTIR